MINKIGIIGKNNFGTEMEIIEDLNGKDIIIEFHDEFHYRKKTTYSNFKLGQIKNPYDKTVLNVGYLGVGEYKTGTSKKHTLEYIAWKDMLSRCYYKEQRKYFESYYNRCTVCEEWHNFQNFAKWYWENYYKVDERLHVDKDVLYIGNTIYSPETCILIPQKINMQFMSHRPNKHGLPSGIRLTNSNRFTSEYKGKYLGTFKTIEEAKYVHDKEKWKSVFEIIKSYENIIPKNIYELLINYKPI